MNQPTITYPTSLYRPKRAPRILKSHFSVARLIAICIVLGFTALLIAYRNISFEQLKIQVAQNRAEIATVEEEIHQLQSQVDAEISYPTVANWAEKKYGWRPIKGRVRTLTIPSAGSTIHSNVAPQSAKAIHE